MIDRVREKGDQHICYNMVKLKIGEFYILNDVSDHVTLFQLIDTSSNVAHDVSIIGCWIYDYNYKRSLTLIK